MEPGRVGQTDVRTQLSAQRGPAHMQARLKLNAIQIILRLHETIYFNGSQRIIKPTISDKPMSQAMFRTTND